MRRRTRWLIFLGLLAAGVGLSLLSTLVLGQKGGWGFLFLPLVFPPFVFGGKSAEPEFRRECGSCGWWSTDPSLKFCPRDGSPLR